MFTPWLPRRSAQRSNIFRGVALPTVMTTRESVGSASGSSCTRVSSVPLTAS